VTAAEWLDVESESTIALAESVSLAVLIEPALLRRARLELTGSHDAGVEADVWFSSLVVSRGPDGIVFHREAAELLRERLAASKPRVQASWDLIRTLHANASPALRLEEEIAWLLADGGNDARPRIRECLRRAIATLVGGERTGLAHWAVQAIHRLPRSVAELEEVRMLDAAARLRLGESLDDESLPEWMSWITPQRMATRQAIGIRVFPGVLELEPKAEAASGQQDNAIVVPALRPLTVEVDAGDGVEPVVVDEHGPTLVRIGDTPVRIRTSDRALYEVVPARSSERELRRQVIDFSELLGKYERPFVMPEPLAELQRLTETGGTAVLLTGIAGTGKTALLNQLATERRAGVIQHFFSNRTHRWRDATLAIGSLAAQAELLLTSARVTATSPVQRLRQLLDAAEPSGRPVLIVLDGIDEMEPVDQGIHAIADLFEHGIPPGVALICACNSHSRAVEALRASVRSSFVVVDLDEERWQSARSRAAASLGAVSGERRMSSNLLDAAFVPRRRGPAWLCVQMRVTQPQLDRVLDWLPSLDPPVVRPVGDEWSVVAIIRDTEDHSAVVRALQEIGARDIAVESFAGTVAAAWQELSPEQRAVLGVIAAAREPLIKFRVRGAASPSGEDIDALLRSLRTWLAVGRTPDHEDTYAPRHERMRQAIQEALHRSGGDGAVAIAHSALLATAAAWSTSDRGEFQHEYALRYALTHAALAGNTTECDRLLTDLDFLEARCALDGPQSLIDDLTALSRSVGSSRLADVMARAIAARADWIARDSAAIRFVVHAALRNEAMDVESHGRLPAMRLRHPVIAPHAGDFEHRRAIDGCLEWDTRTRLTWDDDGSVRVWDVSTGAWRLEHRFRDNVSAITGACALPDGEVAWASADGTVRILAHRTRESRLLTRHDVAVRGVTNPQSGDVVSWDASGGVRVTDHKSGQVMQAVHRRDATVTACLAAEGVVYCGEASGVIQVWTNLVDRVGAPQPLSVLLEGHTAAVTSLVWSDFSRMLLSTSEDGTVRAWDVGAAALARLLKGHESAVLGCLTLDRTPSVVTWSRDHTLRLWDLDRAAELQRFVGHAGAVLGARLLENGRLLSWSSDHTLRLWDLETAATLAVFEGHTAPVTGALENRQFAIVSCGQDRTLLEWTLDESVVGRNDAPLGPPAILTPRTCIGVSNEAVLDCAIDDRGRPARRTQDGVKFVDLETNTETQAPRIIEGRIIGMATGRGGSPIVTWSATEVQDWSGARMVATAANDGEHIDVVQPLETGQMVVGVRDAEGGWLNLQYSGSMMRTVNQQPRDARVNWLTAIGANEVACGWSDGTVHLCSAHPGYPILFRPLGSHVGESLLGVTSGDRRVLVTAGADHSVKAWTINDAYSLDATAHARLEGHTDRITGLAVTPDGGRAISTSRDRTIRVWSVADGRLIRVLRDHRDWVTHVAISPDGTRMTTASADRTIKLWSLETYECLGTAYGDSRFLCLAMSADTVCAGDAAGNFWILDYGIAPVNVGPPRVRTAPIHAAQYWNDTGIQMVEGRQYRLTVVQGTGAPLRDANFIARSIEGEDWDSLAHKTAQLLQGKRVDDAKWLALIGTIDGKHPWKITDGGIVTAPASGALRCFFNDVQLPAFYKNNSGWVELDVEELSTPEAAQAGGDSFPAAKADPRLSRRYVVSGRVGGVGFRYFVQTEARRLNVVGSVRNMADGRIEVVATGSAQQHADLKQLLAAGPPAAKIERVEEEDIPLRDDTEFIVARGGD
jgi:WD40 repeat protein/acylphosphatase